MEKQATLLHLVLRGAVEIETHFLIGDMGIAMAPYQNYIFFAIKIRVTSWMFSCPSGHSGYWGNLGKESVMFNLMVTRWSASYSIPVSTMKQTNRRYKGNGLVRCHRGNKLWAGPQLSQQALRILFKNYLEIFILTSTWRGPNSWVWLYTFCNGRE